MKPYRIEISLILFLCLIVFGCERGKEVTSIAKEDTTKREIIHTVELTPVTIMEIPYTISAVGSLLPKEKVTVSSEINGTIKTIYVDEGHQLEKAQIILKIDDENMKLRLEEAKSALKQAKAVYQKLKAWIRDEKIRQLDAQVRQAKIEHDRLEKEYKRYEFLYETKVIDKSYFDKVAAQYEIAKERVLAAQEGLREAQTGPTQEEIKVGLARIERARASVKVAQKALKDTTIVSPIEGVVSKRMVSKGEYVRAGTPLVEVIQVDPLKLAFSIPERFAGEVGIGKKCVATVKAFSEERFEGNIYFVSPNADPSTRNFLLKAWIPNKGGRLKPGFFADVELVTRIKKGAKVLPEEAITLIEGKPFIFIFREGKVFKEAVQVGKRFEGKVEVISSRLSGNDQVVVAGQEGLDNGMAVKIISGG